MKVCSLAWRNVTQWSKLLQHFLFWSFYNILSICIYHWVCKSQSRAGICSSQDLCLPASVQLASYMYVLSPGICPTAICSLSLFLADKIVLTGILCLREYKWTLSRFRPSLHCCSLPISTQFRNQVATSHEYTGIPTCQPQSPSDQGMEFFWWASMYSTLMQPSDSHSDFCRTALHKGIDFIDQFSIALLPDHMARPLATD